MGRTDLLEKTLILRKTESRKRRGQERMKWLGGHEFEEAPVVGEEQGSLM